MPMDEDRLPQKDDDDDAFEVPVAPRHARRKHQRLYASAEAEKAPTLRCADAARRFSTDWRLELCASTSFCFTMFLTLLFLTLSPSTVLLVATDDSKLSPTGYSASASSHMETTAAAGTAYPPIPPSIPNPLSPQPPSPALPPGSPPPRSIPAMPPATPAPWLPPPPISPSPPNTPLAQSSTLAGGAIQLSPFPPPAASSEGVGPTVEIWRRWGASPAEAADVLVRTELSEEEKARLVQGCGWAGWSMTRGFYVGNIRGISRLGIPSQNAQVDALVSPLISSPLASRLSPLKS